MNYIERELATEIEMRMEFIRSHYNSEVKSRSRKLMTSEIEKTSQVHSYRMENPQIIVPFSVPRNKHKKEIRQGIKNIERAFEWGIENFDPGNFDDIFVREIAGRVTPELYDTQIAQYRDRNVVISGASVTPPYPTKLIKKEMPEFIQSLRRQLKCPNDLNKIEAAIYAHLHLARIHPFLDGNGRTARVVQNVILYHNDIPPPVIETGERMTYYKMLDQAVLDIDESKAIGHEGAKTEGESLFYNYMAGKINASLDKIIYYCNNHFH
ncbi:MAG: Fic family protein [Candidatus Pacearchaeota archaeon]|nr:Fic family protein [Candidatus Pacearchaeota archaeon]MDE1848499.1 Fic family protein [Nanoarchaeota archaeon]